jgi:hypothetical protein
MLTNKRTAKLRSHFYGVTSGKDHITNTRHSKLFIESICDQPQPVECLEKLISSPKGLEALQTALRLDVTVDFLNSSARDLLQYLQAPELGVILCGDFLRQIIIAVVHPPIFWVAFVKAQQLGRLTDETLQTFAWLLLQLVYLPPDQAEAYYGVAKNSLVQRTLLQSPHVEIQTLGQKIRHVIDVVEIHGHVDGSDGPGGRHDNDMADFRKIALLPTAAELLSKDDPFIRRAAEIEECEASSRLSVHLDNQFRLSREDMIRDLREELLVATRQKQGRRKGLLIDDLSIHGVECNETRPWALMLECSKGLPQIPNASLEKRRKFLDDNFQFLKKDSLACLIADGEITTLVTIYRDTNQLALSPPIVCVHLTGNAESATSALLRLKLADRIQLIQLNTATFAYEPVLKQLQLTKQISLEGQIMNWKKNEAAEMLVLHKSNSLDRLIKKLEADPSCDLQSVLKLPKSTRLDECQARCLLSSLTQLLSMIQGPPGKTIDVPDFL